uniref:hypothetical protein n=1 Tax=Capnocytophaga sputigena TaxID=1019 RepID=UPI00288B8596
VRLAPPISARAARTSHHLPVRLAPARATCIKSQVISFANYLPSMKLAGNTFFIKNFCGLEKCRIFVKYI